MPAALYMVLFGIAAATSLSHLLPRRLVPQSEFRLEGG